MFVPYILVLVSYHYGKGGMTIQKNNLYSKRKSSKVPYLSLN